MMAPFLRFYRALPVPTRPPYLAIPCPTCVAFTDHAPSGRAHLSKTCLLFRAIPARTIPLPTIPTKPRLPCQPIQVMSCQSSPNLQFHALTPLSCRTLPCATCNSMPHPPDPAHRPVPPSPAVRYLPFPPGHSTPTTPAMPTKPTKAHLANPRLPLRFAPRLPFVPVQTSPSCRRQCSPDRTIGANPAVPCLRSGACRSRPHLSCLSVLTVPFPNMPNPAPLACHAASVPSAPSLLTKPAMPHPA